MTHPLPSEPDLAALREARTTMSESREPAAELAAPERADPFAPHDLGCRCYPHVSQHAAIEGAVQAAAAEYRPLRATPDPFLAMSEPRGVMTAAEMIEWIDTHPPLPTHPFMEPCGQAERTDSCWFCGLPRAPHPGEPERTEFERMLASAETTDHE